MWQHQTGRIDFDEPLYRLAQQGWRFREYAPIAGARDVGFWRVIGVRGGNRVKGDRRGRREAWAEAARLALITTLDCRPPLVAPVSGPMAEPPDDPTHCHNERARLTAMGWSFSEHLTDQASGRNGWAIIGTRSGRTVRIMDDDRSDAWGAALILAAVIGAAAPETPPSNTAGPFGR